jgi:hypothetical protein
MENNTSDIFRDETVDKNRRFDKRQMGLLVHRIGSRDWDVSLDVNSFRFNRADGSLISKDFDFDWCWVFRRRRGEIVLEISEREAGGLINDVSKIEVWRIKVP